MSDVPAQTIQYTFRGTLMLIGALHIGSGDGDDRTDATVVRDSRGTPYIPGSSVRGALRAAILRYAPTLVDGFVPIRSEEDLRALEKAVNEKSEESERVTYLTQIGGLNPAERLFGTTLWASPLHILDLPLIQADQREIGEIRHGVGIDRDTGVAADGLKYDFEVLPSGYSFQLHMRCEMDRHEALWSQLLALGLRLLELGELTLGGRAARGVGQVQLRDLTVYRLDTTDRAALRAALLSEPQSTARYGIQLANGWAASILQGN